MTAIIPKRVRAIEQLVLVRALVLLDIHVLCIAVLDTLLAYHANAADSARQMWLVLTSLS